MTNYLDEALRRVSILDHTLNVRVYRMRFNKIVSMQGSERLFHRIALAVDYENLLDYMAEVNYALIFAGLRFQVQIEPFGSKGADLGISRDNQTEAVEVTRFRPMYPGPVLSDNNDAVDYLPQYGNPERDTSKAISKISGKFEQCDDKVSIIAIWNDDQDMEEIEVGAAAEHLRSMPLELPAKLSFIVYGSEWVLNQQLYCFPVRHPLPKYLTLWQEEICKHSVSDHIQRAINDYDKA